MSAVSNGDERAAYSRTTLHPFLIKYLTSVNVHWGYMYSLPSGRDCCLSSISLRFRTAYIALCLKVGFSLGEV